MPSPDAGANWAQYVIGDPESLPSFPAIAAEQSKQAKPPVRKFGSEEIPKEIESRAIWIVHGMGQQIPFATLDSVTAGLLGAAAANPANQKLVPTARSVRIGDQIVQRVELKINRLEKPPIELHLYEAYWAPLTEGVAKLRDVISFLLDGGGRGVLNSLKPFKRAMFGGVCDFKILKRIPIYILSILLILASLAFTNAVILAASAKKLQILGPSFAILANQWPYLTALASALCAVAITFGATLFIAIMWQTPGLPRATRRLLSFTSSFGALLAASGIVSGAFFMFLIVRNHWKFAWLDHLHFARIQAASTALILLAIATISLGALVRARTRSEGRRINQNSMLLPLLLAASLLHVAAVASPFVVSNWLCVPPPWSLRLLQLLSKSWWVWPFLAFLSSHVRTLLIQFVGDVAIYVTSNKIDRFHDVRQKIKEVAHVSASAVFLAQARDEVHFEYERIAIIGHSLGSVIAYDTLNRLINEDYLSGGKLRVAERTVLFETFGSPLNKIAFLFTIQGKDSFQIREQLAESVQPLITDYSKFRTFPWINVRSPFDIISGEVNLYDWSGEQCAEGDPKSRQIPPGRKAKTQIDPDACVALAAHVEYWKNTLIWKVLYNHITAGP